MPYIPADGGSSSGSGQMSYPIGRMNETAQKMITNANNALEQHNAAWAQIQTFVQSFPGFMQAPVMAVLNPYERRLRASYQWQIDCANALTNGSQQMQQTDHAVAHGFGRD
jgi:hypothetical protein